MTKIELDDKQFGLLHYALERARADNEGPQCFESIVIDEYVDADEYPTNDELDGEEDERQRNKAVAADLEALIKHVLLSSDQKESSSTGWRDVCPETFSLEPSADSIPESGEKDAKYGTPFWRTAGIYQSEDVLVSDGKHCYIGYYRYYLDNGPFSGAWYEQGPDAYRLENIIKWMPLPKV